MKKIIKKRGFKYLIAFLIPFLILVSMTIRPIITNVLGQEILIKTSPFDPRDLFKGDYVQLNYEISNIPLENLDSQVLDIKGEEQYNAFRRLEKETLYITLKKDNEFYTVDRVYLKKPREGIYLKGKYVYPIYEEQGKYDQEEKMKVKGIRVEYSLDKYFIPENTGKDLEEAARKGDVLAKIKIYKGYSLLKDVTLE